MIAKARPGKAEAVECKGNIMNGYKTYTGIVGIVLFIIAESLFPNIIPRSVLMTGIAFFSGLSCVGVVHKIAKLTRTVADAADVVASKLESVTGASNERIINE